jgi:hypothetical protein
MYWNGEAMHTSDDEDLGTAPERTQQATRQLASDAAHLAALLAVSPCPPL